MRQEIDSIISSFFQKDDFDQVTVEEITSFIEKYPFVTSARFLLAAKKLNEGIESAQEDMVTAGLYFHNPLRLHWLTEQAFVTKQPVFAGQPDTQIVDEQTRVEP